MASDSLNGNYAQTNGQVYDMSEQNYESHSANHSIAASHDYGNAASGASGKSEIPKDEVGWYFVEQYYLNLSKSPEKLFLFYQKQSQFLSGTEAEKVSVCVGQKAINDRIKELDFKDCKVRVTNVDSQGSRSNIVIQVIGEISNKSQPLRKFTQTFVLAEQTNGYFVLNDIFRYIIEDDEYEPGDEAPQAQPAAEVSGGKQEGAAEAAPATLTSSQDPVAQEKDAQLVDKALEATKTESELATEAEPAPYANGVPAAKEEEVTEEVPAVAASDEVAAASTEIAQPTNTAAPLEAEKPSEPEPTPAASPPASAAAPAPAPQKPSGPKTWATIAGGNRLVPAIPAAAAQPAPSTATTTAKTPAPAPAPAAQQAPTQATAAPAAQSAPAQDPERTGTPNSASEWQTAGHEHSRKQSKMQGGTQAPAEISRGYIKSVTENIDPQTLQDVLAAVSTVTYVDISRPKSCAFVDFATPADYRAAVAASPFEVNGQRLFVEERRIRPFPANGFPPRGGMRGGRGGPAGGAPRGGMQPKDGPRGGFGGGRGRGSGFRGGRGGAPAAA